METIVVLDNTTQVATVGTQGTWGAAGGTSFVAGERIAAQKLVALFYGLVAVVADPIHIAHAGLVVGMARTSAGIGETVVVDRVGEIDWRGAALTPGTYFVGLNGTLSTTTPPGAKFAQIAGQALDASTFVLNLGTPVRL